MTTAQAPNAAADSTVSAPNVPVLGDAFTENPAQEGASDQSERNNVLSLSKKNDEQAKVLLPHRHTSHPNPTLRSGSPSVGPSQQPVSPQHLPASPGRNQQTSPRINSPTSSLIFERNVQEEIVPATASPAIPAHIATENHIPPILEEASKAITDDLDPDTVEIVTHAAHQPAAAAIPAELPLTPLQPTTSFASGDRELAPQIPSQDLGASPIVLPVPKTSSIISAGPPVGTDGEPNLIYEEGASSLGGNANAAPNYASLDATDVRRLSFISFADVVHAEQAMGGDAVSIRDSDMVSPPQAPTSPPPAVARSPSPMRSPTSPSLSTGSGAGSGSAPFGDIEGSPSRRARAGSPAAVLGAGSMNSSTILQGNSPPIGNTGGELTIETMRQALRNTHSSDMSGIRSSMVMSQEGLNHEGGTEKS